MDTFVSSLVPQFPPRFLGANRHRTPGSSKSSALEVCYWFLPLRPLSLANWGYRKRCTANLKTATLLKLAAQLSG